MKQTLKLSTLFIALTASALTAAHPHQSSISSYQAHSTDTGGTLTYLPASTNSILRASVNQSAHGQIVLSNDGSSPISNISITAATAPGEMIISTSNTCTDKLASNAQCIYQYNYSTTGPQGQGEDVINTSDGQFSFSYTENNQHYSRYYDMALASIKPGTWINSAYSKAGTANALSSNTILGVKHIGDSTYVLTDRGLEIAHHGMPTFVNHTYLNGLGNNWNFFVTADSTGTFIFTGIPYYYVMSTNGGATFKGFSLPPTSTGRSPNIDDTAELTGTLYFATNGGLYITTPKVGSDVTFQQASSVSLQKISFDAYGNLYGITADGHLSESQDGGKTFKTGGLVTSNPIIAFYAYTDPNTHKVTLFASDDHNTSYVSYDDGQSFQKLNIPYAPVYSISAHGSTLYFGTERSGLIQSQDDGKTFSQVTYASVTPKVSSLPSENNYVDGIAWNSDSNELMIATPGGLGYIDSNNHATFLLSNTLGSASIANLTIDNNGNLYAATDGGLSISHNAGAFFSNYTPFNGSPSFKYDAAPYIDSNNTMYAISEPTLTPGMSASYSLVTSKDGGQTFTNTNLPFNIENTSINAVFSSSRHNLYVGASTPGAAKGLKISSDQGKTFTTPQSFGGGNVYSFTEDPTNQAVYLRTDDTIYGTVDDKQFFKIALSSTKHQLKTSHLKVTQVQPVIVSDAKGTLYTQDPSDGLDVLTIDPTTGKVLSKSNKTIQDGLSSNNVFDITIDKKDHQTVYALVNMDNGMAVDVSHDGGNSFTIYDPKLDDPAHVSAYNGKLYLSGGYTYSGSMEGLETQMD